MHTVRYTEQRARSDVYTDRINLTLATENLFCH